MNRKGFTLVELLATIVILSVVAGIAVMASNYSVSEARNKTEEVFIDTLENALKIYLDSDAKRLSYSSSRACTLNKTHGTVNVYKKNVTFYDVISSTYSPMLESDMVNPANEKQCNASVSVSIYYDDDYVYYYKISKSGLNCLNDTTGYITNLPEESSC